MKSVEWELQWRANEPNKARNAVEVDQNPLVGLRLVDLVGKSLY